MFGLHSLGNSIAMLANQSIYPLGKHTFITLDLVITDLPQTQPEDNHPIVQLGLDDPHNSADLLIPGSRVKEDIVPAATKHFLSFPTVGKNSFILPPILYPQSDILTYPHLILVDSVTELELGAHFPSYIRASFLDLRAEMESIVEKAIENSSDPDEITKFVHEQVKLFIKPAII